MPHHEHGADDSHRAAHLNEAQLRDAIAKAEAQKNRVRTEGSPGAQRAQDEREEELREELHERLDKRRKGTSAEGRH